MTTSVLRRELEEARQRAGDAERLAEERLTLLHELQDEIERMRAELTKVEAERDHARSFVQPESMRAVIRELDATKDALKSARDELEELRDKSEHLERDLCRVKISYNGIWHDRALKARGVAYDLYTAFRDDPDADDAQRAALERARRQLEYWGVL